MFYQYIFSVLKEKGGYFAILSDKLIALSINKAGVIWREGRGDERGREVHIGQRCCPKQHMDARKFVSAILNVLIV